MQAANEKQKSGSKIAVYYRRVYFAYNSLNHRNRFEHYLFMLRIIIFLRSNKAKFILYCRLINIKQKLKFSASFSLLGNNFNSTILRSCTKFEEIISASDQNACNKVNPSATIDSKPSSRATERGPVPESAIIPFCRLTNPITLPVTLVLLPVLIHQYIETQSDCFVAATDNKNVLNSSLGDTLFSLYQFLQQTSGILAFDAPPLRFSIKKAATQHKRIIYARLYRFACDRGCVLLQENSRHASTRDSRGKLCCKNACTFLSTSPHRLP